MSFHLDICENSVKYKYFDSLSEVENVKCIHIEKKKLKIRITLN